MRLCCHVIFFRNACLSRGNSLCSRKAERHVWRTAISDQAEKCVESHTFRRRIAGEPIIAIGSCMTNHDGMRLLRQSCMVGGACNVSNQTSFPLSPVYTTL